MMPADERERSSGRPLRFEGELDPDFQREWIEARRLTGDQVERAFSHGLEARDRFADRPFREVEEYLRESWTALGSPAPWDDVCDIVESGYERARAAPVEVIADLPPEALDRFADRTVGGSSLGGRISERSFLGAAEPVSDYEGEGGPPVEKGRRVRDRPSEAPSRAAPRRARRRDGSSGGAPPASPGRG